jgi:hypothetical protein
MPHVMFTIAYGIKPECRDAYLALSREMKEHFARARGQNYAVYEVKGRSNQFLEVFLTKSMEEFDALEDNQDETTEELVRRLGELIDDGGMKYTTLIEME